MSRQSGKRAVNEETASRRELAGSISIVHRRGLIEQRINQVKTKLATIQPQFIFHNTHPLLRLRPPLNRETRIDTEMQTRHDEYLQSPGRGPRAGRPPLPYTSYMACIVAG